MSRLLFRWSGTHRGFRRPRCWQLSTARQHWKASRRWRIQATSKSWHSSQREWSIGWSNQHHFSLLIIVPFIHILYHVIYTTLLNSHVKPFIIFFYSMLFLPCHTSLYHVILTMWYYFIPCYTIIELSNTQSNITLEDQRCYLSWNRKSEMFRTN